MVATTKYNSLSSAVSWKLDKLAPQESLSFPLLVHPGDKTTAPLTLNLWTSLPALSPGTIKNVFFHKEFESNNLLSWSQNVRVNADFQYYPCKSCFTYTNWCFWTLSF